MKNLKSLILVSISIISLNAFGLTMEVTKLCEDSAYFKEEIQIQEDINLGDLVINTFDKYEIPYVGTRNGINTMLGTLVGLDSYEILADDHMRVYGWCFSVDGVSPDVLMSEIKIEKDSEAKIRWYYGYAELIKNDWITYCTPTYKDPQPFVCKDNSDTTL